MWNNPTQTRTALIAGSQPVQSSEANMRREALGRSDELKQSRQFGESLQKDYADLALRRWQAEQDVDLRKQELAENIRRWEYLRDNAENEEEASFWSKIIKAAVGTATGYVTSGGNPVAAVMGGISGYVGSDTNMSSMKKIPKATAVSSSSIQTPAMGGVYT
jgi:hypothetical protein